MRILITSFKPFKGRKKNGSQALAHYLQAHFPADEVLVADIPVLWAAVESVTGTIIEKWQPDIILGLGEGRDGSISFETIGKNARKGEDVDGNPPPAEFILENGDADRVCRFSFTWTKHIPLPSPLIISMDAGAYLCNNALYYYCGTKCIRVGFVHVPPQVDADDSSYCALYGPILHEILQQNINAPETWSTEHK
jgi:pyroglutamyl-peptidase